MKDRFTDREIALRVLDILVVALDAVCKGHLTARRQDNNFPSESMSTLFVDELLVDDGVERMVRGLFLELIERSYGLSIEHTISFEMRAPDTDSTEKMSVVKRYVQSLCETVFAVLQTTRKYLSIGVLMFFKEQFSYRM